MPFLEHHSARGGANAVPFLGCWSASLHALEVALAHADGLG